MGWTLGPGYRQTALPFITLCEICITHAIEDVACFLILLISVFLPALGLYHDNQMYNYKRNRPRLRLCDVFSAGLFKLVVLEVFSGVWKYGKKKHTLCKGLFYGKEK